MRKGYPFKIFTTRPEIVRLAVMPCVRFPLSFRYVEELLQERGIAISHEIMRFWRHRFAPMFASGIAKCRTVGHEIELLAMASR